VSDKTLVIACGALARELIAVKALNRLEHLDITCLPAILHNRPHEITPAVRRKIRAARGKYREILCLYGDCGTGGALDAMLAEEGVGRIAGAHCYAFYAGLEAFDVLMEEELGSFFLTDYLACHFDRLVWAGLGLDRHPELRDDYFRHYTRLVHLAQSDEPAITAKAERAAERLALPLETRFTGFGMMVPFLTRADA
jgi:hypothetical protein